MANVCRRLDRVRPSTPHSRPASWTWSQGLVPFAPPSQGPWNLAPGNSHSDAHLGSQVARICASSGGMGTGAAEMAVLRRVRSDTASRPVARLTSSALRVRASSRLRPV